MYKSFIKDRGFTIVESLVAISILVGAIIGTTSAVQTGISSYILSKDQIIAFYLAQEGYEQIKNIRDENNLNGINWLTGIASGPGSPCAFGEACTVDPGASATPIRCDNPGECPIIRQDLEKGFYGYNPAYEIETNFKRQIMLSLVDPANDHEVAIVVTVDWSKGTVERQFKIRGNLLDW